MRKKIFVIASILLIIFSNINANENNYGKYTVSTIYNNFTQETNLSYALLFGTEFAVV